MAVAKRATFMNEVAIVMAELEKSGKMPEMQRGVITCISIGLEYLKDPESFIELPNIELFKQVLMARQYTWYNMDRTEEQLALLRAMHEGEEPNICKFSTMLCTMIKHLEEIADGN
jgi:hypothetical protein